MNTRQQKEALLGLRGHFCLRGFSAALLAAILVVGGILPALAVHNLAFELDGDIANNDANAATFDWADFFDASGARLPLPTGFTASSFSRDFTAGSNSDNSEFTTGSKDTLDITPGWQCKGANNVGDKVDILNSYAAAYQPTPSDDMIIYFGLERSSNSGAGNVGFWFLQDPNANCAAGSGGATNWTGRHIDGDFLLVSEFSVGGAISTIKIFKWQGTANPNDPLLLVADLTTPEPECGPALATPDKACAIVNTSPVTPPWPSTDKDGGPLNPSEFYEGGVNVTQVLGSTPCLATFVPNTRSSPSITATLFDYAVSPLNTCNPTTKLTKTASASSVIIGSTVTFTYTEQNDGNVPLTTPSVTDDSCAPVTKTGGDTNNNNILDVGETWTYTCSKTFTSAGTFTNIAIGHGAFNGQDVTFCADPNNPPNTVRCDQDERATATVTVLNPSTKLTKSATPSVSTSVTYSYTEQNDGSVPLSSPSVVDDKCSPVVFSSGDTNSNGVLDPGETWTFTCAHTFTGTGTFTNVAVAHGSFTPTGVPAQDVTFCDNPASPPANTFCDQDERASKSVTVSVSVSP